MQARTKSLYIPVKYKYIFCFLVSLIWTYFCLGLAKPWIDELSMYIYPLPAVLLIFTIAIIPGFIYMFMLASLLFDKRPAQKELEVYPPVSIIVPVYNEKESIELTLHHLLKQQYPGEYEVIVVDDGSTDGTLEILKGIQGIRVINNAHGGKSAALNTGLQASKHDLIVSVDSDTLLWKNSLKSIVQRISNDPPNTASVAGVVLARNSRHNLLTQAQEWDYFHGIASIKRMQSLFQSTLVCQGAFSIYKKAPLIIVGGWKNTIGEDIVLTWNFLQLGFRTGLDENAISFTNVPASYSNFFKQRQRWARGMIEGFKYNPMIIFKLKLHSLFLLWNLLFPILDSIYLFIFIPGLILALYGYYFIVGPMTFLVLPLTLVINSIMYTIHGSTFDFHGLKVRKNYWGFVLYILFYQLLLSPASVSGYFSEIFSKGKSWGTR